MKNIYLILSIIISVNCFAQKKYYWNGKYKEVLNEDFSSIVIFENEETEIEIPKSNIIKEVIRRKDIYNGKYKIINFEENKKNRLKSNFINNKSKIKSQSYAFINQRGEKIWLSHYVVFRLKPNFSFKDLSNSLLKYNADIVNTNYGVTKLRVPKIRNVLNIANEIYESGKVFWCHPDFLITAKKNSISWKKQFYLKNYYHSHCGFDHDINASEAWNITKGCPNIIVAVIDDGVEDHPELNDKLGNTRVLDGFTPSGVTVNGRPSSSDKHGQACAGIIAASHSDEIQGIAPNIKILPVKVRFGSGIPSSEFASAIRWAWNNGADVLSNSWSGGNSKNIIDAIDSAKVHGRNGLGSIVVFSSGNEGKSNVAFYAQHAIAVGAININDKPAELLQSISPDKRYTNIGPNQDIVAYGSNAKCEFWSNRCPGSIRTIDRIGDKGYATGNYYDEFCGTSAACPQVSAAAALILSVNPNLSREKVENILFSTTKDLGTPGRDNTYGYGKLDVFAALKKTLRTLNENFHLSEGYLSYHKIIDNDETRFYKSPKCGIAPGMYLCDVYKAEASIPYTSDWFWYTGDGLSGSNYNNGELYIKVDKSNGSINIKTFFYFIKTNIIGQTINEWAPFNPSHDWARKYEISPPENVIYNQVVYPNEQLKLYATNSIKIHSGFQAKQGSILKVAISISPNDIICAQSEQENLKSGTLKEVDIPLEEKNDITKKKEITSVKIYPNPNDGNFIINISEDIKDNATIKVFDLTGKLLHEEKIKQQMTHIDFRGKKGIYILNLFNGNSRIVKKIIIE